MLVTDFSDLWSCGTGGDGRNDGWLFGGNELLFSMSEVRCVRQNEKEMAILSAAECGGDFVACCFSK